MLLLDKSALESLNIDEAVWLDMFFGANICPIFYVETLADLEKSDKTGRTSEKIVADLARKTPSNCTFPNAHHKPVIVQDLIGNHPPVNSHYPLVSQGGVRKDAEGKFGYHIEEFAEQAAMDRWFREEFTSLERDIARGWRESLNSLDPDATIELVKSIVPNGRKFSTLDNVKAFADEYVRQGGLETLNFMLKLIGVPSRAIYPIQLRYIRFGQPSLETFAPYASFVLRVDIFYYLCLSRSFISKERASNKADIAYLYYLPFCHAFVSKDNLHSRVAQLFMENGQRFIGADELKKALKNTDDYYSQFKDEIEKVGLMRFTGYPSPKMDNLVTEMWDQFMRPDWREIQEEKENTGNDGLPRDEEILERIKKHKDESVAVTSPVDESQVDYAIIGRKAYSSRRGKWRVMPPELDKEFSEKNED